VGDMTGAMASPSAVAAIKERYPDIAIRLPPLAEALSAGGPLLSYTQWEAFLALYHRKVLIIGTPNVSAPRDPTYAKIDAETTAQQAHLERLKSCQRYPEIRFANADDLIIEVLRSKLQDILRQVELSFGRKPDVSSANDLADIKTTEPIHLIVLIHGINTYALWESSIKNVLQDCGFKVAPTSYGMLNVGLFLLPIHMVSK
jgi:hypothetical protein